MRGEHLDGLGVVGAGHAQVVNALDLAVLGRFHRERQRIGQVDQGPAGGRRVQQHAAHAVQPRLGLHVHRWQAQFGRIQHPADEPFHADGDVVQAGLLRAADERVAQLEQRQGRLPDGEDGRAPSGVAHFATAAGQLKVALQNASHGGNVPHHHPDVSQPISDHHNPPVRDFQRRVRQARRDSIVKRLACYAPSAFNYTVAA